MSTKQTARELEQALDCIAYTLTVPDPGGELYVGDVDYIVTTSTGDGTFAYRAEDVAAWLCSMPVEACEWDCEQMYSSFCDRVSVVTDEAVAVAWLAETRGTSIPSRLCRPGTCEPILSDEGSEE